MAFVEMWKNGKRVSRRGPDGQRAPGGQGYFLPFESGQATRFTASGTTRIGDQAGGVLGDLPTAPPRSRSNAVQQWIHRCGQKPLGASRKRHT